MLTWTACFCVGNMETTDPSPPPLEKSSDVQSSALTGTGGQGNPANSSPSTSSINSLAKSLNISQASGEVVGESQTGGARSTFARLTSGLGLRLPASNPVADRDAPKDTAAGRAGVFDSLTKGFVDSSRSAVKAVQAKARHMVSQNKRRYQVTFHLII